jgi:cytochrome P450
MDSLTSCPVVHDFDPLDKSFLTDPFPQLAAMREESPVLHHEELDLYFVTRWADIEQVLLDRDTFAAANASSPVYPICPAAAKILSEGVSRAPTLTNADPPRHAPMRRAVLKNLTPRRLLALEPVLRENAQRLIDGFAGKPVVDLVADLAFPLPAYAGFSLLGFPEADWELLKSWCTNRILLTYGRINEDEQVDVANNVVAFWNYVKNHVANRQAEPANDFTTDLLAWSAEHEEVTLNDVVSIVYSIALAGHDSTTNLFTGGLRQLLAHQSEWKALVADPSLIDNAVEEMLRFDPPILGWRRITTTATSVGGVDLPAGAQLFMTFASAHHDERQFPDPDRFDITRENARTHFSFGKGVHLCLGAPLARLEMRITLELLTGQYPDLRLVDDQDFEIVPNLVFRTMRELLATTGA